MNFKRFTSMLLAVLMVFSMIPSTVFAAEATDAGNTLPTHTFTGIITAYDSAACTNSIAQSEQGQPLSVSVEEGSSLWLQLCTAAEPHDIVELSSEDTVKFSDCTVDSVPDTNVVHITEITTGGWASVRTVSGEFANVCFVEATEEVPEAPEVSEQPEHNFGGEVIVSLCDTDENGNVIAHNQISSSEGSAQSIAVYHTGITYSVTVGGLYLDANTEFTSTAGTARIEDGLLLVTVEQSGYVSIDVDGETIVVLFDLFEQSFPGTVTVNICNTDENGSVSDQSLVAKDTDNVIFVDVTDVGAPYAIHVEGVTIDDSTDLYNDVGPCSREGDYLLISPMNSGHVVIDTGSGNAVIRFTVAESSGEDTTIEHNYSGSVAVFYCETDEDGNVYDAERVDEGSEGQVYVGVPAANNLYRIVLYDAEGSQITGALNYECGVGNSELVVDKVGTVSLLVWPECSGYVVFNIPETDEFAVVYLDVAEDDTTPEHTFEGKVTVNICDTEDGVIVNHNEIATNTADEIHLEVTDAGAPYSIFAEGVTFDDFVDVTSTTGPVVLYGDYLLVEPMESGYVAITTADGVIVVYFYVLEGGTGSEPNYFHGGMLIYASEEDVGTTNFVGSGEIDRPVYFGTRDYGETFYLVFGESMSALEECLAADKSIGNVALDFTAEDVAACGTGLVATEVRTHEDGFRYLKVTYTGTGSWIQVTLRDGTETFIAYDPSNNYDFATNFDGTIEVATDAAFTNVISDGRYQHQGLLSMYNAVSCFDTIYVRVKDAGGNVITDAIPTENPGITSIDENGVFTITFADTRTNWLLPILIDVDADGNDIFGAIYFKEIREEEHFTGRIQVFDSLTTEESAEDVFYTDVVDEISLDDSDLFEYYIKLTDADGNAYDVTDLEFITIDFAVDVDPSTNMIILKGERYGPGVIAIKTKNDGVVHLPGYIDAPQITKGVEFAWDEDFNEIENIAFNTEWNEWDVGVRQNGDRLFFRIQEVDANGDLLCDADGNPVYANIRSRQRSSQNVDLEYISETVGLLIFSGDNTEAVRGKLLFMPEGGIEDVSDYMEQTQLTMCYQMENTGSDEGGDGVSYDGWMEVYADAACTDKIMDGRENYTILFAGALTEYYIRIINAETGEPYDLQQSIGDLYSSGVNSVYVSADDPTVLVVTTSTYDGLIDVRLGDDWWFGASFNVTQPAGGTINVYAADGTTLLATGTDGIVNVSGLSMYDEVYVEYMVDGAAVDLEAASLATRSTSVDFSTPTKPLVKFYSSGNGRYAEFRFANGGYETRTSIYVTADVAALENYEGTVTFYDANFEQIAERGPGLGYLSLTEVLGRKLDSGEVFYIKINDGTTDQTGSCVFRSIEGLRCTGSTGGYLGFEVTGTSSWFSLVGTVGKQIIRFGGEVTEAEFSGTVVLYADAACTKEIARSERNADGVNVFELNAAPGEEFYLALLDTDGNRMQPARYFNRWTQTESESSLFGWWGFSNADTTLYFFRNSEETGTCWWYFSNATVQINVSTTAVPFDGTARVYRTEADAIADTNYTEVTGSALTFSGLKQYEKRFVRFYDAEENVVTGVRFAGNEIGWMEQNGTDYVGLGFTSIGSTSAAMYVNGGKVSVAASVAMNDYFAGTLEFYADANATEPLVTIRRTGSDQVVYMSGYAELPYTVGNSVYLRIRNTAGEQVMPDAAYGYSLGLAEGDDGYTIQLNMISFSAHAAFFVGDTMFLLEADVQRPAFGGTIEVYNTLEDARSKTNMVQSATGKLDLTGVEYESTLYVRITEANGSAFGYYEGSHSSGIDYNLIDETAGIYSLTFADKSTDTVFTRLYTADGEQVVITATLKMPNVGMQYALDPAGEWTNVAFDASRNGYVSFTAGQELYFRWTLDGEVLADYVPYFSMQSELAEAVLTQSWYETYRGVTDQGYNGTDLHTSAGVSVEGWYLYFNVYFTVTGNNTASDNASSYKDATIVRVVPGEADQFIADGVVGTLYGDAVSAGFALSGGVLTFDATNKSDGSYSAWVGGKQYIALVFDNTLPIWQPEHNHGGEVHVFEVTWEEVWDEEADEYVSVEKLTLVAGYGAEGEQVHFTAKPDAQYRIKLLDEEATDLYWQYGSNTLVYESFESYRAGGSNISSPDYTRDSNGGCYMTFYTGSVGGNVWFCVDNDPEEYIVVSFNVDSSYETIDHTLTYEAVKELLSAWGELDGVHALRCTGSGELDSMASFSLDGSSMWIDRSSGKTAPVYIVRTEAGALVSMEEDDVVIADYNEFFTLQRITVTDPETDIEYGVYKVAVADGKVVSGARVSCKLIANGSGSLELSISSWTNNGLGSRYGIIRDTDADRAASVNNPNFSITGQQNFHNIDIYVEQGLGLMDSDESLTFYLTKATGQDPTVVDYVLFDEIDLNSLRVFVDGGPVEFDRVVTKTSDGKNCIGFAFKLGDINTVDTGKIRIAFNTTESYGGDYKYVDGFTYCYRTRAVASDSDSLNDALGSSVAGDVIVVRPAENATITVTDPVTDVTIVGSVDPVGSVDVIMPEVELKGGVSGTVGLEGVTIVGGITVAENSTANVTVTGSVFKGNEETVDLQSSTVGSFDISGSFFVDEEGNKRDPVVQVPTGSEVVYSPYYYYENEQPVISADINGSSKTGDGTLTVPVDTTAVDTTIMDGDLFKEMAAAETAGESYTAVIPVTEKDDDGNTVVNVIWSFSSDDLTNAETVETVDLAVSGTLSTKAQQLVQDEEKNTEFALTDIVRRVNFTHEGVLPGTAEILVRKTDNVTPSELLLYYVDVENDVLKLMDNTTVTIKTVDGVAYYAFSIDHCSEYVIVNNTDVVRIGETSYESIDAALNAAVDGDTVTLLADVSTSMLMVEAGVTLDLNGHYLSVERAIISFGQIKDSSTDDADATVFGGIKISNDLANRTNLQTSNEYLPIYDTAEGCYRFFDINWVTLGGLSAGTNRMMFGFRFTFVNAEGYKYLAESENTELAMKVELSWTGLMAPMQYVIKPETVVSYAQSVYNGVSGMAIILTLSGTNSLASGYQITAIPRLESSTDVVTKDAAAVYSESTANS